MAQLVEHHLAKVRVAGSNPVVRSEVPEAVSRADGQLGSSAPARPRRGRPVAEWPSGLGKGLQSPVRGFDSRFRLDGRLAQRESASLTRKRPLVQSQYRPPGQTYYSNARSLMWLTRKSQSRAIQPYVEPSYRPPSAAFPQFSCVRQRAATGGLFRRQEAAGRLRGSSGADGCVRQDVRRSRNFAWESARARERQILRVAAVRGASNAPCSARLRAAPQRLPAMSAAR